MNFDFNNIVIALFVSATLTGGVAIFAWQRRRFGLWAKLFTCLMVAVTVWTFGYGLEIGTPTLSMKIVSAKFQYVGIVIIPIAWFLFTLAFTGRTNFLTKTRVSLLAILPVVTLLLVMTNESHQLIWQAIEIDLAGYFHPLIVAYGPWFWVHSAFSYVLMLLGSIVIFRAYLRFNTAFRWQNGILLLSALTPWLGNAVYIFGIETLGKLDLSPFGLGVTGILLSIGIFQNKLFDLVPVARRMAVENMSDGVIILDLNSRIVDMNPAAEKILGCQLSHVVGEPVSRFNSIEQALNTTLAHSETQNIPELEIDQRHYELLVSSIWENNEFENGKLISLRDITYRKEAEKEQEKRTQTLETLNSLSSDIASSLDLEMILGTVVEEATKLLNMTSAYVNAYETKNETTTVIAEYYSPESSSLERVSDLGTVYNMEDEFGLTVEWVNNLAENYFINQVDDPETIPEERTHMEQYGCKTAIEVPLYAKGKLIGTLELWESRYRREFSQDDLALIQAIAQQAAVALYNANLYEEALSASRFKSRLLAQVNHELRTPLSVILLYSEMLEAEVFGSLSADQAETVGKVISNTNYLHSLVEQLLAQAEFENGDIKLNCNSFSSTEMVEQAVTQLQILADRKELRLSSEIDPNFPPVLKGDREKIYQILINLISNGIKYTDSGSIHIALFQSEPETWSIQVTDTGIGIALEDQVEIFEPFWQTADVKTKLYKDGTGLGLSIVKQLTQLMNGQIDVQSEPGKGSRFTVTLPCQVAVEATPWL